MLSYIWFVKINYTVMKYFFYLSVLLFALVQITFCQDRRKFEQLPISTQNGFNQIALKYHSGKVDYATVENDLKKSGIDYSNMSVEDAVMMMFMLISNDARKEMSEMLKDMDATRKKRSAMRQAEELMKKELDSLRNQAHNQYNSTSKLAMEKLNEKEIKLDQYRKQQKEVMALENKNMELINAAKQHLQSVEEAINKLQQIQPRKKLQ
jgi:hypothetical protein